MSYVFGINYMTFIKDVCILQQRHQQGETHALTIEDILDETSQLDVGQRIKHWLITEVYTNLPFNMLIRWKQ